MTKARIWELDALRGIALAGMLVVHLIYDLTELTGLWKLQLPEWYVLLKDYGGAVFLLISGICAQLGSRHLCRGFAVFSCGMLCTAVTGAAVLLELADSSFVIWFGALHCLGLCMLLWPLLQRLPRQFLLPAGLFLTILGLWACRRSFPVSPLLIPLGFAPEWFATSDYFPLLPNLGWFLLGAWLGPQLYPTKSSLFPEQLGARQPVKLLCAMGRHSLVIYLLHQPLLAGIAIGLSLIL